MKSLFIDTSSSNVTFAIVNNNNILATYINKIESDLSKEVFSIIDNLFKESQMVPNDIDTIFIVNGPGSFTGVRIGVTIAKTYAWALKKKIVPVSSLELMASGYNDNVVAMIDARRNFVYAGVYDKNLNNLMEDCYINIDELISKTNCKNFVSYDNLNVDKIYNPKVDILKVINKHINDNGENPHTLKPNYLKLTEAEEKLNKKND